jgi:hypothetical protein
LLDRDDRPFGDLSAGVPNQPTPHVGLSS